MRYISLCVVGAAVALLVCSAAHASHVDYVVNGAFSQNGDGSTIMAGDPGSILGGLRRVDVDVLRAHPCRARIRSRISFSFETTPVPQGSSRLTTVTLSAGTAN